MKIDLHYGHSKITLDIPQRNIGQIIRPFSQNVSKTNSSILKTALRTADRNRFIDSINGKFIGVLIPDSSRDLAWKDILPLTFELIKNAEKTGFFLCTGTHDSQTAGNLEIVKLISVLAEQADLKNYFIHVHDCEVDKFANKGRTKRGTHVLFNSKADEADCFLSVSDVKFHYFAGYSNPLKNLVPGLCDYKTTEANHSLALEKNSSFGRHPWHNDPSRKNNPLAEDMVEALSLISKGRDIFSLVTISTDGDIQWAGFGDIKEVSSKAFDIADKYNAHKAKPAERLIVSPGGFPNDESMYMSQRALELTRAGVTDGGEVLFISQCSNGFGAERTMENFYCRLTKPLNEILRSIEDDYKLFSHKPYKFAKMITELGKIWVYSEIEDEILVRAHLYPTADPQEVVNNWIAENGDIKINIVDGGNKVGLY